MLLGSRFFNTMIPPELFERLADNLDVADISNLASCVRSLAVARDQILLRGVGPDPVILARGFVERPVEESNGNRFRRQDI